MEEYSLLDSSKVVDFIRYALLLVTFDEDSSFIAVIELSLALNYLKLAIMRFLAIPIVYISFFKDSFDGEIIIKELAFQDPLDLTFSIAIEDAMAFAKSIMETHTYDEHHLSSSN